MNQMRVLASFSPYYNLKNVRLCSKSLIKKMQQGMKGWKALRHGLCLSLPRCF